MFDVLVYLYQNWGAFPAGADADALTRRLLDAGFDDDQISAAIGWLQGLARSAEAAATLGTASAGAFRVYADFEVDRLGAAAIDFLTFLERAGQLSAAQREIVIERALASGEAPIALDRLKVIVLMVLWCQQAEVDVLVLEELLDDGEDRLVH
jgi:Smg protein